MRLAFITPWDLSDPGAWSGTIRPAVAALTARVDLLPHSTKAVGDHLLDRVAARVLDAPARRYLVGHAVATAHRRGRRLRAWLAEHRPEAIIGMAASQDLALLRTPIPVLQVADTTFGALLDFYPDFSRLHPLSAAQAGWLARRATRRTTHFLAATDWARDALRRDGVPAARITVAPFGPGIEGGPATPRSSDPRPVRILVVASDWQRKDAARAVAVAERLRTRGRSIVLTVVGDVPAGLPSVVRTPGRVDRAAMAQVYADHDVLLDLARANTAGVTLTDAAAAGLPVVATAVGGVATIVADRVTGRLVPAHATVDEVADVIEELFAHDVRAAMGTAAYRRYRSLLNWDNWAAAAARAAELVVAEAHQSRPSRSSRSSR